MGRSLTVKEKGLKKIVGGRIKLYREQRRISQAKLATMIGKGRDYWDNGGAGGFIRKVEKEGTLDVTLLKTIGDALGIPLFSFFDIPLYSLRNMGDMLAQLAFICRADVKKIDGGYAFCVYHRPMKSILSRSNGVDDDIATYCILRFLEKLSWILPLESHYFPNEGRFSPAETEQYRDFVENALKESTMIDYSNLVLGRHSENMKNQRLTEAIMELPAKTGDGLLTEQRKKENELDEIYKHE